MKYCEFAPRSIQRSAARYGVFLPEYEINLYDHRCLGECGITGLDFVEIYPQQNPNGFSSHPAAWTIDHALAGLAEGKRSNNRESGERQKSLSGKEV